MPVPSRRLKDLIEGTVDHHASQRWPALEEVTIRWRGSYGYLTGYLSEDDDDTIELCRIQYLGDPDEWAFAIWQASTDSYAGSVLLDGRPAGHPNLALDTACTLYLAGTSDYPVQPDKPLKDLRGAALVHARTLLVTIPEPAEVLAEMVRLARPGGWVEAGQEPDAEHAICYPALPAWTRLHGLFQTSFGRNGADLLIGRRLAELYREAGLRDVQVQARARAYPAGRTRRTVLADLVRSLRPMIVELGPADERELTEVDQAVRAHLADPRTVVVPHLWFTVWGRKPAG